MIATRRNYHEELVSTPLVAPDAIPSEILKYNPSIEDIATHRVPTPAQLIATYLHAGSLATGPTSLPESQSMPVRFYSMSMPNKDAPDALRMTLADDTDLAGKDATVFVSPAQLAKSVTDTLSRQLGRPLDSKAVYASATGVVKYELGSSTFASTTIVANLDSKDAAMAIAKLYQCRIPVITSTGPGRAKVVNGTPHMNIKAGGSSTAKVQTEAVPRLNQQGYSPLEIHPESVLLHITGTMRNGDVFSPGKALESMVSDTIMSTHLNDDGAAAAAAVAETIGSPELGLCDIRAYEASRGPAAKERLATLGVAKELQSHCHLVQCRDSNVAEAYRQLGVAYMETASGCMRLACVETLPDAGYSTPKMMDAWPQRALRLPCSSTMATPANLETLTTALAKQLSEASIMFEKFTDAAAKACPAANDALRFARMREDSGEQLPGPVIVGHGGLLYSVPALSSADAAEVLYTRTELSTGGHLYKALAEIPPSRFNSRGIPIWNLPGRELFILPATSLDAAALLAGAGGKS
ncbi:hypothetical protein GPECTOR_6g886 [Gonium pectorale]|uniref:Uncharacterized protein n=1 Tax=Gonium pectorale TaxID=33097 RepID=A0A150GVQ4_GONPE|nr:hypothetical protein GPECTOR_6g886 [Gonium pectorale]|eukprot:KXZ53967.1 hypothetical protein GPECTOR_6g886 [Gonium pectorale]